AAVLTFASEAINEALLATGHEIPGAKQILYGIALGLSIMFMPHGIWPGIARRFGFGRHRDDGAVTEAVGTAGGGPGATEPGTMGASAPKAIAPTRSDPSSRP